MPQSQHVQLQRFCPSKIIVKKEKNVSNSISQRDSAKQTMYFQLQTLSGIGFSQSSKKSSVSQFKFGLPVWLFCFGLWTNKCIFTLLPLLWKEKHKLTVQFSCPHGFRTHSRHIWRIYGFSQFCHAAFIVHIGFHWPEGISSVWFPQRIEK